MTTNLTFNWLKCSLVAISCIVVAQSPAIGQTSPYFDNASPEVLKASEECYQLHKDKDYAAAEAKLEALLAKLEKAKNPKPVDLVLVAASLTGLYKDDKKPELALPHVQHVLALDKKRFSPKSIFIAEDLKMIGDLTFALKKFDESEKAYSDALKIAVDADESEYFPCVVAFYANRDKKKQLVMDCYEGIAKSNFQPENEATAEDYFSKAMAETMQAADSKYRHARARLLFKYYGEFLNNSKQTEKLAKLNQDIKDYEKKIQINREWTYDNLPAD